MDTSKDDNTTALSENLKFKMKDYGISQADIARGCQVSSASVTNWVHGGKNITHNKLLDLSDFLCVTKEWLLARHEDVAKNAFSDRLKFSMSSTGMTKTHLYTTIGSTTHYLSSWLNDTNTPSREQVYAMAAALSVDAGWLLHGGSRKVQNELITNECDAVDSIVKTTGDLDLADHLNDSLAGTRAAKPNKKHKTISKKLKSKKKKVVKLYSLVEDASGDLVTINDQLSVNKSVFEESGANPSLSFVHTYTKDSMYPAISTGSKCLIDISKVEIENGHMYAFKLKDNTEIAYLYNLEDSVIGIKYANQLAGDKILVDEEKSLIEIIGWVFSVRNTFTLSDT